MTQGARICPHCKRRVDERRAKGLAYCLSCGQPLAGFAATSVPPSLRPNPASQFGGPPSQVGSPQSQYGAPQSQYGTPPPSQYGGAMPPSQYGAPSSQYASAPGNYGTPPPGTVPVYPVQPQIQQQKGSGAVGLIIGIVIGLGGLMAIVIAIIIVAVGKSSSSSSSSASDDTPASTVAIESPTTTASDDSKTAPTANGHHPRPTTSSSSTTATSQTGTEPFPATRANERLEQAVLSAERVCPRTEGPFGTTVVEVTFETDGRVGTLSNKPIGGTPEGDCITAQFLEIHLGAFEGTRRTFAESVTMQSPKGSTAPSATTTGRTNKPDAGH